MSDERAIEIDEAMRTGLLPEACVVLDKMLVMPNAWWRLEENRDALIQLISRGLIEVKRLMGLPDPENSPVGGVVDLDMSAERVLRLQQDGVRMQRGRYSVYRIARAR